MLPKNRLRYKKPNKHCKENIDYVIHSTSCNMWFYIGFFPSTHHSILKPHTYYRIYGTYMNGEYLSYEKFDEITDKL